MMTDAVCGIQRVRWTVWISLLFTACVKTTPPTPTPQFVAWSQDLTVPKRVCVLPFRDQTQTPGLAKQVRQSVAGHLSIKHFRDVELSDVDERLAEMGGEWRKLTPQQIGEAVGCDALLYGDVTEASRLYLALYSQLTVAASIQLVDVATGQTLVQESYATKFREGGVPLSPLAIIPDAVKTFSNLSETQMTRAIDDLGRNLTAKIPDLPTRSSSSQEQVVTTATASPSSLSDAPVSREPVVHLAREDQPPSLQFATASFQPLPASKTEESASAVQPRLSAQQSYRLQVAKFRMYRDAQRAVRVLRDQGYPAMIAQTVDAQQTWNRVVLGPYPSLQEARQVGASIRRNSSFAPVVIRPASR